MKLYPRVTWKNGMFLMPQHFQMEERFVEGMCASLAGYLCPGEELGLTEFRLNKDYLSRGRIGLDYAAGIFPDGTPFELSTALFCEASAKDAGSKVWLCVPGSGRGEREHIPDGENEDNCRFVYSSQRVYDNTTTDATGVELDLSGLSMSLHIGDKAIGNWVQIPIALIDSVGAGGEVVLDETFVPPCRDFRQVEFLTKGISAISEHLKAREKLLNDRASHGGDTISSKSMVRDYIWTVAIEESIGFWGELAEGKINGCAPSELYNYTLSLLGRLRGAARRCGEEVRYWEAEKGGELFTWIFNEINGLLHGRMTEDALMIPLDDSLVELRRLWRTFGPLAMESDDLLHARFILIVSAREDSVQIMRGFPGSTRVAPHSMIADIVINAVDGIPMHCLAYAPPELRSRPDAAYFEIDASHPLFRQMIVRGEPLALHTDESFHDVKIELCIINC